jgi:hypothetical protein
MVTLYLISKNLLVIVEVKLYRSMDSTIILLIVEVYILLVIRGTDIPISIVRFRVVIFSVLILISF